MTTINLRGFFDAYSLRARLQPGFLAVLPAVTTAYLVWNIEGVEALWPIFVAAGGTFLLANIVRSRGLTAQERLVKLWDGIPTTRALRLRTDGINAVLRDRRRTQIEAITSIGLPTRDAEIADPLASDETYEAATRILITKVREKPDIYPRVQEENTHYGFRRNLYGLKSLALAIPTVVLAGCVVLIIRDGWTNNLILALAINGLGIAVWSLVIKPDWVRQAGERYAERLFDTLEDISQPSHH